MNWGINMKSKIIKILLFLFIGLECLALTNRERIEKDLRKLNITDSTMIAQTINIDEKLGDKLLQGETIEGTLKNSANLPERMPVIPLLNSLLATTTNF